MSCRRASSAKDLANPIGNHADRLVHGQLGHVLAAPAGHVGRDLGRVGKLDPGLGDDPPSAGTTATKVERAAKVAADPGAGALMPRSRLGHRVEHTLDDLADDTRR